MAYKKLSEVGGTSSFDSLLAVSGGVVSQVSDEDINSHYGIDEIKANIDNIEVNIDEVEANIDIVEESIAHNANRIDILKSNLISLTAEGESISINDSGNGSIVDLTIAGRSEQTQYTGKNILPYPHYGAYTTSYGITFSNLGNGKVGVKGTSTNAASFTLKPYNAGSRTLLPAGTYTVSGSYNGDSQLAFYVYENQNDSTILYSNNDVGDSWTFTIENDAYYGMYIYVPNGTTVDDVVSPQLELGSEATSYEPYVGGIPSPNPDYPQAINSSARKGKNLLPYPYINSTVTKNGITFTDNGDGSITVNGTATTTTFYKLNDIPNPPSTIILSGCPGGGAYSKYQLGFDKDSVSMGYEYGEGASFDCDDTSIYSAFICVRNGTTMTNHTFYPMVRDYKHDDISYEPYIGDSNIIAMKSIGKNFFNNTAVTETRNGITFTINEDKSVTINGTATANIYFALGEFSIPNGSYVFSGCEDGSASSHLLYLQKNDSSGYVDIKTAEKKFTISDQDPRQVLIAVYSGATVSNVTLYPMIRQDGVDGTYEPYKYSNSNITLTEPLRSLPNGTKDEIIYNSDGTGKIIRRVGVFEIVAESMSNTMFDNGTNALVVNLPNKVVSWHEDTSSLLCSKVIAKAYSEGYTNGMYQNAYNVVLVGDIDDAIEEVRAKYLGSELYYQLATPTEESLTSEQLQEIENLQTYRTITNIYTDDIVKSNLQVSYVVDTKTYIDNKFTELATAMLNS